MGTSRLDPVQLMVAAEGQTELSEWGTDRSFEIGLARLIDAVEARKEPGSLIRLEGDEVPAFMSIKISPHQLGVPDMLAAAHLMDVYPERIVLWGVQPELMEIGLDLSPTVEAQVKTIIENVLEQLQAWGHTLMPKEVPV